MEDTKNKFIVYVLRSLKTGYHYIGQTNDLERRLAEHEAGETRSIRFQRPFIVEYIESYPSRLEAMHREKWLKSGVGREWLDKHKNDG